MGAFLSGFDGDWLPRSGPDHGPRGSDPILAQAGAGGQRSCVALDIRQKPDRLRGRNTATPAA